MPRFAHNSAIERGDRRKKWAGAGQGRGQTSFFLQHICVTVTARLASTQTALVSQSLVGLCFAFPPINQYQDVRVTTTTHRPRGGEGGLPLHALVTSAPSSILWQPSDEHAPTNEDEQSDEHAIKEPTRLETKTTLSHSTQVRHRYQKGHLPTPGLEPGSCSFAAHILTPGQRGSCTYVLRRPGNIY